MSGTQSLIDDAVAKAKARLGAGVQKMATKEASAEPDLIKEASEIANALEFVALNTADDGSAAGAARMEMVRDFLSKSAETHAPSSGPTKATGMQTQPPTGSGKAMPGGPAKGGRPATSEAKGGAQDQNAFRQMPPAVAATPKDGGGKSAGSTLYDILMANKEAASGGPATSTAEEGVVHSGGPDGERWAHSILGSNESPVSTTKRDAKKPTRPRLAEAFDTVANTTGDATARAVWPGAAAKGDMKVASIDDLINASTVFEKALNGEFGKEAQDYASKVEAL